MRPELPGPAWALAALAVRAPAPHPRAGQQCALSGQSGAARSGTVVLRPFADARPRGLPQALLGPDAGRQAAQCMDENALRDHTCA
jgi:hypothetical protein